MGKRKNVLGQVESTDTFNSSRHQATIKHLNQQYILRICDGNQCVGMNIFLVISFRGGLFVEGRGDTQVLVVDSVASGALAAANDK
jgi:hypothetical protein